MHYIDAKINKWISLINRYLSIKRPGVQVLAVALSCKLILSAKLHAVEPFAYLKDVLERVVTGRTKVHQLDELLPWQWKATSTVNP